jgi:hypothetical protein
MQGRNDGMQECRNAGMQECRNAEHCRMINESMHSRTLSANVAACYEGLRTPTGQLTPVPPSPQYPPGFLARYCW